ncbi:hypothetical protein RIF29_14011 [Crotalaria pallida]|uniref:Uncharacterized protein n=1 Tax=Crotalaria pallida TaxID=3830 RepID=A0AAN9IHV0_CROPI
MMAVAADTNVYLFQRHQNNSLDSLLLPMSHIFIMDMERGPRYKAYSELREKKLLMKYLRPEDQQHAEGEYRNVDTKLPTPPRKQVKFQGGGLASGIKGSSSSSSSCSVVAQSVPDFTAVLRKENRKPVVNMLPSVMELTPPSIKKGSGGAGGVLCSSRGSVSASGAGDKRRVLMARKSYASIDELRSFSKATASAINGESRGGRSGRVVGRSGFGYRQF